MKFRKTQRYGLIHITSLFMCQLVNEDDDESSDDETSEMVVDEPKPRLNLKPGEMSVDEPKLRETVEAEDGWTVVGPKRNKGKRN